MSTPRKFKRTIERAFKRITLDGADMHYVDAYDRFNAWRKHMRRDETWKKDLHDLFFELTLMDAKSIGATTSGTTGPPKHLRIARRDLVNSARLTAEAFDLHEGDRALLCLPCQYIAGKMMLVRAMALGLDLHVIDPRGSVLENLKVPDRFRFTAMVPLQLHRAVQEDRERVKRQFDTILLGGGPVSQALEEDVQGLGTAVFHGYGSTETVTHVALRRLNGAKPDAHYRAIGRVYFSKDPRGCLVVHTPHLTRKEHITNDLVELEDDRHFRWLGRIDNVILSGGKKFYPEQMEKLTGGVVPYPHYFMPVPDDLLGEAVAMVLETEHPPEEVIQEVVDAVIKVLPEHQWPRRMVALRKFKRTPSGKVIRERFY